MSNYKFIMLLLRHHISTLSPRSPDLTHTCKPGQPLQFILDRGSPVHELYQC
jgi:hypothetical protein